MTKGDKVKYIGRGFVGFIPTRSTAEFIRYVGRKNAEVLYNGYKILVYKHEIEEAGL